MPAPTSQTSKELGRALQRDLETLARTAPVPPASAVWFRAERRARLEAIRRADQPIWLAERLALVGGGVVAGWLGNALLPWFREQDLLTRLGSSATSTAGAMGHLPLTVLGLSLVGAIGASIAVLVATAGER